MGLEQIQNQLQSSLEGGDTNGNGALLQQLLTQMGGPTVSNGSGAPNSQVTPPNNSNTNGATGNDLLNQLGITQNTLPGPGNTVLPIPPSAASIAPPAPVAPIPYGNGANNTPQNTSAPQTSITPQNNDTVATAQNSGNSSLVQILQQLLSGANGNNISSANNTNASAGGLINGGGIQQSATDLNPSIINYSPQSQATDLNPSIINTSGLNLNPSDTNPSNTSTNTDPQIGDANPSGAITSEGGPSFNSAIVKPGTNGNPAVGEQTSQNSDGSITATPGNDTYTGTGSQADYYNLILQALNQANLPKSQLATNLNSTLSGNASDTLNRVSAESTPGNALFGGGIASVPGITASQSTTPGQAQVGNVLDQNSLSAIPQQYSAANLSSAPTSALQTLSQTNTAPNTNFTNPFSNITPQAIGQTSISPVSGVNSSTLSQLNNLNTGINTNNSNPNLTDTTNQLLQNATKSTNVQNADATQVSGAFNPQTASSSNINLSNLTGSAAPTNVAASSFTPQTADLSGVANSTTLSPEDSQYYNALTTILNQQLTKNQGDLAAQFGMQGTSRGTPAAYAAAQLDAQSLPQIAAALGSARQTEVGNQLNQANLQQSGLLQNAESANQYGLANAQLGTSTSLQNVANQLQNNNQNNNLAIANQGNQLNAQNANNANSLAATSQNNQSGLSAAQLGVNTALQNVQNQLQATNQNNTANINQTQNTNNLLSSLLSNSNTLTGINSNAQQANASDILQSLLGSANTQNQNAQTGLANNSQALQNTNQTQTNQNNQLASLIQSAIGQGNLNLGQNQLNSNNSLAASGLNQAGANSVIGANNQQNQDALAQSSQANQSDQAFAGLNATQAQALASLLSNQQNQDITQNNQTASLANSQGQFNAGQQNSINQLLAQLTNSSSQSQINNGNTSQAALMNLLASFGLSGTPGSVNASLYPVQSPQSSSSNSVGSTLGGIGSIIGAIAGL